MMNDERLVFIVMKAGGLIGKIYDFSKYMLLDANIKSLSSSTYVVWDTATIKQVSNRTINVVKKKVFSCWY